MGSQYFDIEMVVTATIELDDAVIDVVDDEWRAGLYNLHTPEEIAEHIACNLVRGARLSMLDGWADQPDRNACFLDGPEWEVGYVRRHTPLPFTS